MFIFFIERQSLLSPNSPAWALQGSGNAGALWAGEGLWPWVCPGSPGAGGERRRDGGIAWEPPCRGAGRLYCLREWASGREEGQARVNRAPLPPK